MWLGRLLGYHWGFLDWTSRIEAFIEHQQLLRHLRSTQLYVIDETFSIIDVVWDSDYEIDRRHEFDIMNTRLLVYATVKPLSC